MTPTGQDVLVEDVLAAAPPARREPAARERIGALNVAAGRRIAVLDDDPTGSQTVHDVSVVTVFEAAEYAAGLADVGDTCFILTNTRSLPEAAAVELTTAVEAVGIPYVVFAGNVGDDNTLADGLDLFTGRR